VKIVAPTAEGIAEAARAICAGHVVAYPTETVYGLAVDPFSPEALQRLFAVKARDAANPVLLIVADLDQIKDVASAISDAARACALAFWPGPLSMLFPRSPNVPETLTAGSDRVCVRCTASPIARDLCRAVGTAITSTSANRSGQPPARSLAELDLPGIAVGIDAGALPPSPPSTVFDPDTGLVLREGAIAESALRGIRSSRP
jgi:L-threonylcarbamoyladenylate synthase